MRTDGHIHINRNNICLCEELQKHDVHIMASFGSPAQCAEISQINAPTMYPSVGLHPWYCETFTLEEMYPYMDNANIIGEIGMDSVWCNCSLTIQKDIFIKQLQYAYAHQKPVVLHTKGQEETIVKLLSAYPNTYLVHWYSSLEHLDAYIDLDCYFTIGPDIVDPAVHQVVQKVNLNRLLVESDGLEAIAWALHKEVLPSDYVATLDTSIAYIAKIKNRSTKEVQDIINNNFTNFMDIHDKY